MRSRRLLQIVSVCQDASGLLDPLVETLEQMRDHEHRDCPLFERCSQGTLLGPELRNCVPRMAQDVARNALTPGATLETEMYELHGARVFSRMGFIDPYESSDPDAVITDPDEIVSRVARWAEVIMNGKTPPLEEQIANAHCAEHQIFTQGCSECDMSQWLVIDRTEVVYPYGMATRVPRNQCRCPIVRVGDFCPVHGG